MKFINRRGEKKGVRWGVGPPAAFSSTLDIQSMKRRGLCVCVCLGKRVGVEHTQPQIPACSCSERVLRSVGRILCPGCRFQAQATGGRSQQGHLLTPLHLFQVLHQQAVARSRRGTGWGVTRSPQQSRHRALQKGARAWAPGNPLPPLPHSVATPPWASLPFHEVMGLNSRAPLAP